MKEGDLVMVSAEATGLGEPMEAIIDKIETIHGTNPCHGYLYTTDRIIRPRWLLCGCTYNLKRILNYARKKNIVKLNKLHLIKRRRMQKFHARKYIRLCKNYGGNQESIRCLSNVCVN